MVGCLVLVAVLGAVGCGILVWVWTLDHLRLPALDRTPRVATICDVAEWPNPDDQAEANTRIVGVEYVAGDGRSYRATLADLIHCSWIDEFTVGSRWQIYAFRAPDLAESVVFLTEVHDDVWRSGYCLDGVRLPGETGLSAPGPGSPFLNGKRRFVT
ncbi:hypothetical protein FB566_2334 [Stackebrandtia endophytica]|uniref:Uncharacterized protein n=1 Tax=Stackebrandtia endophytica TaxID=1496996 RepID=A0A543AW38_9ACTN|nr:hypothetical protein [Stackebrandtia endophytica]TQL76797.1 hypothetical protein FB566_2334 [Stackebrandtia endophytica]